MSKVMRIDDESVSTRRYAKELAKRVDHDGADALDLSGVEFISRSVADELLHQSERREFELRNAESEVAAMLDAVSGDTLAA